MTGSPAPRPAALPVAAAPPLRVMGVGASAGGLPAVIELLEALPTGLGLACIVVLHLPRQQASHLPALLQAHARCPVRVAAHGEPLAADCVHVIAPDTLLRVAGGCLQVEPVTRGQGLFHPVDELFVSLAAAHGPAAVGVVLSGMGHDGSRGLRALVEAGGLGIVQAPETAAFDAMPRHALAAAGAGVLRAVPAGVPALLMARPPVRRVPPAYPPADEPPTGTADELAAVLRRVATVTGHDFTQYKPSFLRRRIARRTALHGQTSITEYRRLLEDSPQEADLLFRELLIGVTAFLRDPPVWQALGERLLPALLQQAAARPDRSLRAWVIGCSTGEEAYSLAMSLREAADAVPGADAVAVQVFASDIGGDAIEVARRGWYAAAEVGTLGARRLERFFAPEAGGWRVSRALRETVLFARHDVIADAPFSRLDLVCCRNLLIYFDARLQQRLLALLHYVLRPGGLLVLGSSETVGGAGLFEPVDPKLRIYRRTEAAAGRLAAVFPVKPVAPAPGTAQETPMSEGHAGRGTSLQVLADRLMLDEFAPPAVLVDENGDILYVCGRTGRFLEPAVGKANWNVHAMARPGLRAAIGSALERAVQERQASQFAGLKTDEGREAVAVDLSVRPVSLPGQGLLVLVVFRESPPAPARRRRAGAGAPDTQLQSALEEVQSLREAMRSSQEELQSANEELESTNEELQSANEELTTSKEEMQAMNEELQTVNAELLSRLEDLALAQGDLKNLLNSTQIATLFLDGDMNVRRFTEHARKLVSLREADIGRPLTDLTMTLDYPALHDDIAQVLRTLEPSERTIGTTDGRWYMVRIMPYRTHDNVIDGAVLTFVDITAAKALEAQLRGSCSS